MNKEAEKNKSAAQRQREGAAVFSESDSGRSNSSAHKSSHGHGHSHHGHAKPVTRNPFQKAAAHSGSLKHAESEAAMSAHRRQSAHATPYSGPASARSLPEQPSVRRSSSDNLSRYRRHDPTQGSEKNLPRIPSGHSAAGAAGFGLPPHPHPTMGRHASDGLSDRDRVKQRKVRNTSVGHRHQKTSRRGVLTPSCVCCPLQPTTGAT